MIQDCEAIATIPTKNLSEARRFYEQVLGLPIEGEDENMGVWYRCGDSTLFLYETQYAGTAQHTLVSFASEHIDDDIKTLRDQGVDFETYPDMPEVDWDEDVAHMQDMKGVWFKDPDGNTLGMFEKAPALAHA